MVTPNASCATALVPEDEFISLAVAVAAAEGVVGVKLSAFLSTPSGATRPIPQTSGSSKCEEDLPPLLFTLSPRPRFSASLHAAIAQFVHPSSPSTADLHAPLVFHPSHFGALATLAADHAVALTGFPRRATSIASALASRVAEYPRPRPENVAKVLASSLWPVLHPFQRVAVLRAIVSMRGRVLIADDMGMGKTLQALAIAQFYRKALANPTGDSENSDGSNGVRGVVVAVLCPATLRDQWRRAVGRWLPDVPPCSVHAPPTPDRLRALTAALNRPPRDAWDVAPQLNFLILSYDLLARLHNTKDKNDNSVDSDAPSNENDGNMHNYPNVNLNTNSTNSVNASHNINGETDTITMAETLSFPIGCDIVIADECHVLRNPNSHRTIAALSILLRAGTRILVSGTPAQSRPGELFAPLCALLHDPPAARFPSVHEFLSRYTDGTQGSRGNFVVNDHELHAMLSAVMIRRLKSEVPVYSLATAAAGCNDSIARSGLCAGTSSSSGVTTASSAVTSSNAHVQYAGLPPKLRVHIIFNLPHERLEPVRRQLEQVGQGGGVSRDMHFASIAARTAELKVPAVLARLHLHLVVEDCKASPGHGTMSSTVEAATVRKATDENNINSSVKNLAVTGTRKVLLFAHHLTVLDAAEAWTRRHGVGFVRIDGATPMRARDTMVQKFQIDPQVRLAILSLRVAGAGLTLTAADVVLFGELGWVPAALAQGEDRAHRLGRTGAVTVEYVVAPGTGDDAMAATLARKARVLGRTVDGGSSKERGGAAEALDVLGKADWTITLDYIEVERLVARSLGYVSCSDSDSDGGDETGSCKPDTEPINTDAD